MDKDAIMAMIQLFLKEKEEALKRANEEPNLHNRYTIGILEGQVAMCEVILMRIEDADDAIAYKQNIDENA